MLTKNIHNFDYPVNYIPVVEVNLSSTAYGEIVINDEDIDENTSLTATLYEVTPPSSSSENWVRSGNDLYTSTILNLSASKRSDGLLVVKWRLDPAEISNVADGDYYGATISLNANAGASVAQAGIEIIFKINDTISGS